MVSTSDMPSLVRNGGVHQEVPDPVYPGSTPGAIWHRDPATPCTALPPPTVASRSDGQGHAVMTKAYQWRNGDLEKDDKVEYFSNSQKKYIAAQVHAVTEGQDGLIASVDLDCKKRAKPSQIRRVEPKVKECPWKVGENVQYWSASHGQWMQAVVQKIREDAFIDLDIKSAARPERIRATQENGLHDAPPNVKPRASRKSEVRMPSIVATSPPIGNGKPQATAAEGRPPAEVGAAAAQPEGKPMPCFDSGRVPVVPQEGTESLSAVSRSPSTAMTAMTNASPDSSPVAGSSVASSSTVYRNLPAEKLFLGTGLENVTRRKPKRGSDSVFISGPLAGGEIRFSGEFDAAGEEVRQQLLSVLGFSARSKVEKMLGFSGGLNHGIWFLSGTCGESGSDYEELVLKLVRCHRIADNVPTEAENLVKVHREHSSISKDEILAFPIKIFSCFDGPTKKHDLIVMRKVPGERLAEVICRKFYNNQLTLLDAIFEKLGATLAAFHVRYGKQHGDFQPSNIFYDDATDVVYFIDIGGMGLPTSDTDVEHFRGAMTLLAGAYSPTLHEELAEAFQRGYGPA